MLNSAFNKTPNNKTLEKSALFDFSRQGFSPILLKSSRISFYDNEIKESSNIHLNNKDFLQNNLVKEKLPQINSQNKLNSPFNLNFMDRRNNLTKQGIMHNPNNKIFSTEKNFSYINPYNMNNIQTKNSSDKNKNIFLFDNSRNLNFSINSNQNNMFSDSNSLTFSNSNIFKTLKDKSNVKPAVKKIKYADDYSFKKNSFIMVQNSHLDEDKHLSAEANENKEIKEAFDDKNNFRRTSRLNKNENELDDSFSQAKRINSIAFKKNKNLNRSKIINNKKNNKINNHKNKIKKNYVTEKEQKCNLFSLPAKAARLKKEEDSSKENSEIKRFSFLNKKRKANISSSLFGFASPSNSRNKTNSGKENEKENSNSQKKMKKKLPYNNNIKSSANNPKSRKRSVFSSELSESEHICSKEITKSKVKQPQRNASKPIKNIAHNIKKGCTKLIIEKTEKTKFNVEKDFKSKLNEIENEKSKSNNIKHEKKKTPFSITKSLNKSNNQEDEKTSSDFSFRNENKKDEKQQQTNLSADADKEEKNNLSNIIDFKDSIVNLNLNISGLPIFTMKNFDEIFGGKKTLGFFKRNGKKRKGSVKNLISFVDSKISIINAPVPQRNRPDFNNELLEANQKNINNSTINNNFSLDNCDRNMDSN